MATALSKEPKPLQWALPESLAIPPDQLKLRLDFYQDSIMMTLLEDGLITTRMVSALDIARALAQDLTFSSGLLPPEGLWWSTGREGPVVALWRSPKVWRVAVQQEALAAPRRFSLPMPGLVFVCKPAAPPWVWAAKKRPVSPGDLLYHAPVYNVFQDGRSCPGTHQYGPDMDRIPEEFFMAFFSRAGDAQGRSKRFPGDLLAWWGALDGKRRYPLDDLVEIGTVRKIMEGTRW